MSQSKRFPDNISGRQQKRSETEKKSKRLASSIKRLNTASKIKGKTDAFISLLFNLCESSFPDMHSP
jgi:hypothetical protein